MYRSDQFEPGEWGGIFQERSRHWAFKEDMQINCELPTRLRVMGSSAMHCVILDTHGHFSFAICQPLRNGFVLGFLLFIHEFWGCSTSWKIRITIVLLIIFIYQQNLPMPCFLTKNKFKFWDLHGRVEEGCQNVFFEKRRHHHLTFEQSMVQ